jgi:hypothetical protein
MVYTGRFYQDARTPEPFFEALARLSRTRSLEGRLSVLMIGPFVTAFRDRVSASGLDSVVTLRDRVPPEEARQAAADADVLLVIDAPSRGPSLFLPSKVVDYLAFTKPILGVTPLDGATADLLRRLRCPIAPPDDAPAIAGAVSSLLDAHAQGALRVTDAFGRAAAEYDIEATTVKFASVIEQTIAAARR